MNTVTMTLRLIRDEVLALQTRLERLQPLSLTIPMTRAALPYPKALSVIDSHLLKQKRELNQTLVVLLQELEQMDSVRHLSSKRVIARANQQFVNLRLHFNAVLEQIDIFADVLTQRSEHQYDRWLAGLDVAAQDALGLPKETPAPILLSYLDRGHGAAIRRAHTKLPGGSLNPVGLVRIPRERMVGTGLAGSLYHEVGHQSAVMLGLLTSLAQLLHDHSHLVPQTVKHWVKWRSEILADFWAISRLGVAASLGLMSVISLPDALVYRKDSRDPHPIPWIRVMLNLAIGEVLFPDPQWRRLRQCWLARYPMSRSKEPRLFSALLEEMPAFIRLLCRLFDSHQAHLKQGFFALPTSQSRSIYKRWQLDPSGMFEAAPTRVFSVLGQARADGEIDSHEESELLHRLLQHWALNGNPSKKMQLLKAA